MILCTFGQNVIISIRADKLYPFLKEKNVSDLRTDDVGEIKKNTLALLCHKVGSQVVNSTDNILVSKIIGIAVVGIYSNYLLITNALNTIIAQLFSAITASVGNLGATEGEEKSENMLKNLFFANFWFVCIVCAAFYSSIELLISQMFGVQRVLDHDVLVCIVANLYLYNIRRTAWTFRDGYGLFWYDRYKAIAEAIINLLVSVILGIKIGLVGILIGTIVSTVSTSLWIEPYILYKYAFKKRPTIYFVTLGKHTVFTGVVCLLCRVIVESVRLKGYWGFIIGCFISVVLVCCSVCLVFGKTKEFQYYKSMIIKTLAQLHEVNG